MLSEFPENSLRTSLSLDSLIFIFSYRFPELFFHWGLRDFFPECLSFVGRWRGLGPQAVGEVWNLASRGSCVSPVPESPYG